MTESENTKMDIAIGICAYNEAQNIERCIRSIYEQDTRNVNVKEVLVVSSGSTDGTDDIVRGLMKEYDNLTLLPQERREGKNSAINCYLDHKTCDIVAMYNADNVFMTKDSLYKLIEPFFDPQVGMVGGHPVPTNDKNTKVGFATHMLWTMHHNLALIYPKIGELVAFRDIGTRLPTDMQSDEDLIRMRLEQAGYKCVYAPDATILNHGPDTEEDFYKQRLRVNIGECTMKQMHDYDIPSWNKKYVIKAMMGTIHDLGFRPFKMLYAIRLELRSRKEAEEHVKNGEDRMSVWEPIKTTKKL